MDSKYASLVFPHQLFENHPALRKNYPVYLIEETLFFNQYKFHKKKLLLHRASMQHYKAFLTNEGFTVHYIEATEIRCDVRKLLAWLSREKGIRHVYLARVSDAWLEQRMESASQKSKISLKVFPSPNFLNDAESNDFFDNRKRYFQADFYAAERKSRKLLVENDGSPIGGKWSFDSDNRKRFPKKGCLPSMGAFPEGSMVKKAREWVAEHYPDNYGSLEEPLNDKVAFYPVTHKEASSWLDTFLTTRFEHFGAYEDAMLMHNSFLHHSVLSPALNIGLLNPQQVLDRVLAFATEQDIPFNSLEGFVRQVMGWREFIHLVYEREGGKQRTRNYWNFSRKIPASFWKGETGILPVDTVIKRILKLGYCHHIERLMVLGNFMLLCEFDPDDVYRWFMELFVDSYDWVMVPNTYGMTQFADGGLMTTKPYISGSNYLLKMGDWEKGAWQQTWDALFWRFMHQHREVLQGNPRLGMLLKTFDKMTTEKREAHLNRASAYLRSLSTE